MNKVNVKKKLTLVAVMFMVMFVFSLTPATSVEAAQKNHSYSGADYLVNQGKSVQLPTGAGYTYKSDNNKVATVSATGKVTGKKGGYAVITVNRPYGTTTYEVGVKSKTYYPNIMGTYKVGKDIPAGQYVVIHDKQVVGDSDFTFWSIQKSKKGGSIASDGFSYTSIVTLKKGQYFNFNGGYAVPFKKVKKSVFSVKNVNKYATEVGATVKVGYGFPAGTYKFTLVKGKTSGGIRIASKDRGLNTSYDYQSSYLSKSKKTVTVKLKKGQYVEILNCTAKKK